MIKLVKNELIKIFKRKSIYFLFFISIIVIAIYNQINPDQNIVSKLNNDTSNLLVESIEKNLENLSENLKEYIDSKVSITFGKLYNSFEINSWQRYALNEERTTNNIENVPTDYNLDINKYLKDIYAYELNPNSKISQESYEKSKEKYQEYVNALNSNNWKKYVNLKIKNLEEQKNIENLSAKEVEEIEFEIEYYNLRLNNNIEFNSDVQNEYLEEYRQNYYHLQSLKVNTYSESQAFINKNINDYIARMNLCKYAIDNNIKRDISNETNIIYGNKIDARISFIRTFEHFDLIIVIIVIFISTTAVTEEVNKRTIKNLLTKPHKRSNILISKILACIITVIITMIFVSISQFIIGGVIFGFDSYKLNYIGYDFNSEQITQLSLLKYIILVGLSKLPMYIIISTFCILMSVINNNQAMSMILTLAIFLCGSIVFTEWSKVEALSLITRYFITNNWDFSKYLFGQISDISGVNKYSSVIIYLIHLFLLLKLSIYKFENKEINNV